MTPIDQEELEKLRAIAEGMPDDLKADWEGTNHYEITTAESRKYWWIANIPGIFEYTCPSGTEDGRRLGHLLDLGCAAPRLLAEIERLRAIVDKEKQ